MKDITKHKWGDKNVSVDPSLTYNDFIFLATDLTGYTYLNKNDAIAIAEHFRLIGIPEKVKAQYSINTIDKSNNEDLVRFDVKGDGDCFTTALEINSNDDDLFLINNIINHTLNEFMKDYELRKLEKEPYLTASVNVNGLYSTVNGLGVSASKLSASFKKEG